nr:hypothetical protein [Tanacetum cinerariifolium]
MAQIRSQGAPIQSSDPPLSTCHTVGSGEDRMEHEIELKDPVPQTPHDSPLSGGHTPGSDEGSMTLKEFTNLCTSLLQKVLDLEKVKAAQAKEIASLKKRVTKLKQKQSSRISGFHPFRDGTSKRHSLGRRKDDDTEVIVEDNGSGEKRGTTAEIVSTARQRKRIKIKLTEVALKIQADLDKDARTERERQKEASKAALAEMYDEVKAQIDADHELATRLTYEEQEKYTLEERSKLLAEFFEMRKKRLAKERAKTIRSKPPTKTQLRNLMMTYLKHTGRFTHAQLKSRSFEEIQKLYTMEQKWVDALVPIGSEEDEKRVGSRKKRAVLSSKQKSPKKQRVNDQEYEDSYKELRKCLKVVPDDDKAIDYKT